MTSRPLTLDDPEARDPATTGSKAAELARLRASGFEVPDGWVLPIGIARAWPEGGAPDSVREAVERATLALGGPLAVRSSATWEDAATSAHAGASATVLGVVGVDATLDAVRHCLDATAEAQRTRDVAGDVAIVLQRLVPAEWAGVAFTADPVTGERDLVRIAATAGLGEALVSGQVIGSDCTVRGDLVEGDLAGLDARHALAVAEVAREIEALTGRPQDIEWAVAGGCVHVLQARPITVLPVEPRLPDGNNWQKDVAHYPEPLTPFGWSLAEAYADDVRSVFDEMGLLVRGLEERFVGGQIYGRVVPAFGSPDSAGSPPPALILGLAARIVPELRRRNATARRAIATRRAERWAEEWHGRDRAEMSRRNLELQRVDLPALDDRALAAHCDDLLAHARRGAQIHFRLLMPLVQALHRLHTMVGEHLGWDDATTAGMLVGHSPATRAAEEAMAVLRERVRSTPGAADALEQHPRQPVAVLRSIDGGLASELEAWTAEHGWAMVNYDAGVPVLAERPSMITRLILSDPAAVDFAGAETVAERARTGLPVSQRPAFEQALREARAIYPVREDNTIIVGDRPLALLRRWMLEVAGRLAARGVLSSRADAGYLRVDELRSAILDPAPGDLTGRILRRRGEEAWARANPGPLYVGEQGRPPDTSRLPRPLRQVNEPVLWAIGHEYPAPVAPPDHESVLLAGVGVSPGVAEGPARVVRSHHDLDRLQDGDILVCQVTSPAWAPLFPLAKAVIADGGGALSHAAIAAREHGLPAVLGTGTATTTLRDGQRVRVDGTRGLVLAPE